MEIKIELADKLKEPLNEIVNVLKETNKGKKITKEIILAQVCKQYIAQEYAKELMK